MGQHFYLTCQILGCKLMEDWYISKFVAELLISQENLKKQDGKEQIYSLVLDQEKINQPLFVVFYIPKNIKLEVRRIEILHNGAKII